MVPIVKILVSGSWARTSGAYFIKLVKNSVSFSNLFYYPGHSWLRCAHYTNQIFTFFSKEPTFLYLKNLPNKNLAASLLINNKWWSMRATLQCTTWHTQITSQGQTALHLAVGYNKISSVKTLIELGANIDIVDFVSTVCTCAFLSVYSIIVLLKMVMKHVLEQMNR